MSDNSVQTDYVKSLNSQKHTSYLPEEIANNIGYYSQKFGFVNLGQWILLGLLNSICLLFMSFAYMWID